MRSSVPIFASLVLLASFSRAGADPSSNSAASSSSSSPATLSVPLTKPGGALSSAEAQSVLAQYKTLELQLLTARQAAIQQASQAPDDASKRKILSDFAKAHQSDAQTLHGLKAQIDQYNQVQPAASVLHPS